MQKRATWARRAAGGLLLAALFFSPFLPGPHAGAIAVGGGASFIVDAAVRVDAEASIAMPMCPGGRCPDLAADVMTGTQPQHGAYRTVVSFSFRLRAEGRVFWLPPGAKKARSRSRRPRKWGHAKTCHLGTSGGRGLAPSRAVLLAFSAWAARRCHCSGRWGQLHRRCGCAGRCGGVHSDADVPRWTVTRQQSGQVCR